MDVDAAAGSEPAEVVLHATVVLSARDQFLDVGIQRLDADFELEGAGWELRDEFAEGIGQAVGDHLEVDEETLGPALEEELEDAAGDDGVEVECAVDELELADAPIQERLHGPEEAVERELADGNVERGQAELAGEGATTGGLDIDHPVGAVAFVVEVVGELEMGGIGDRGVEDVRELRAGDELAAEIGEREVRLARDDVMGEGGDLLLVGLVTDLGSAEDDDEIGIEAPEDRDQLGGGPDVPDVDAKAEDGWAAGEDLLGDVERALVDVELADGSEGLEFAQIGQQVTQPERRVWELGVERGEEDPGGRTSLTRDDVGRCRVDEVDLTAGRDRVGSHIRGERVRSPPGREV